MVAFEGYHATSNPANFTMAAFVDNVLPIMLLTLQMGPFADNMLPEMKMTLQMVVFVGKVLPASNAANCSSKVVSSLNATLYFMSYSSFSVFI